MSKYPYGADRKAQNSARTDRVMGYKKGGAVEDNGTNIHIEVGGGTKDEMKPPMPMMAPPPPMPPPGPPPGGPMGGPPPMMGMKRGGRTGGKNDLY